MGKTKDGSSSMNQRNKRKTAMLVWRPVSTESASQEVYVAKELQVNSRASYRPIDCSEEPISDVISSLASSASNLNCDSQCEYSKTPCGSPSNMENLPESFKCRTISLSEKAIHVERVKGVKGESLIDSVPKLDAEVANKVAKLSVPLEVDASLIRFVKGKWGSTQKQIEEATGVTIIFPSSKDESCLLLEGISEESVAKASKLIASVLDEVVKSPKLDYSHFISLPLAIYPELVEKLQNFQNNVLGSTSGFDGSSDGDSSHKSLDVGDDDSQLENQKVAVELKVQGEKEHVAVKVDTKTKAIDSSDLGIEKSVFIKPKTFHLTVLMLKLWNKDLVDRAAEVLQKISSKVNDALDNRPVSVKLEGLECMRGSPAKARVLYAPVKEIGAEGRLLRACQVIIEAYVEADLVLEKDARQALKLHATIMNARHRKWKKGCKKRDSFDARGILRRYGSEEWGDYMIREAHLSRRFSFDLSGYYHCCASIPFPESVDTE